MTVPASRPRRLARLEAEVARLRERELDLQIEVAVLKLTNPWPSLSALWDEIGAVQRAVADHAGDERRHTGPAR